MEGARLKYRELPQAEKERLADVKRNLGNGKPDGLIGWRVCVTLVMPDGSVDEMEAIIASVEHQRGSATKHAMRYDTGECESLVLDWKNKRRVFGSKVHFELVQQVPPPGPARAGLLLKRATSGKNNWKQRHIVLCGYTGRLQYFVPGQEQRGSKGCLALSNLIGGAPTVIVYDEIDEPNPNDKPLCFKVQVHSGEELVMCAETREMRDLWVSTLRDAIEFWTGESSGVREAIQAAKEDRKGRVIERSKAEFSYEKEYLIARGLEADTLLHSARRSDDGRPQFAASRLSPEDDADLKAVRKTIKELRELLDANVSENYDDVWTKFELLEEGKKDVDEMLRACRLGEIAGSPDKIQVVCVEVEDVLQDAIHWLDSNESSAPPIATDDPTEAAGGMPTFIRERESERELLATLGAPDTQDYLIANVSTGFESIHMHKWRVGTFDLPGVAPEMGSTVNVRKGEAVLNVNISDGTATDARGLPDVGDYIQIASEGGEYASGGKHVLTVTGVTQNVVTTSEPFKGTTGQQRRWRRWDASAAQEYIERVEREREQVGQHTDAPEDAEQQQGGETAEQEETTPHSKSIKAPEDAEQQQGGETVEQEETTPHSNSIKDSQEIDKTKKKRVRKKKSFRAATVPVAATNRDVDDDISDRAGTEEQASHAGQDEEEDNITGQQKSDSAAAESGSGGGGGKKMAKKVRKKRKKKSVLRQAGVDEAESGAEGETEGEAEEAA